MATISASPAVSLGALRSGADLPARRGIRPAAPAVEDIRAACPQSSEAAELPDFSSAVSPRVQRLILALLAVFAVSLAAPAVAGAFAGESAGLSVVSAPAGPVESPAYPAYTVLPGDTLWSIAERVNPQADPRGVVLQLRVLNALAGDHVLRPGDVLQVPTN